MLIGTSFKETTIPNRYALGTNARKLARGDSLFAPVIGHRFPHKRDLETSDF